MKLKRPIFQAMVAHLQMAYPLEACGLLAGASGVATHLYAIHNVRQSGTAYEMDPKQQLEAMLHAEAEGCTMLAIYHSHPTGPQTPSPTDVSMAYYPELVYLIVSLEDVSTPVTRAFTISDGAFAEVSWRLV